MAALHAADLTSSFWYRVAKQTLGHAGEGGESFLDAPEGSYLQLNIDGRHLYFLGAMGASSLHKEVTQVLPARAGTLLHACYGLWQDLGVNRASPRKNNRIYHKMLYTEKREMFLVLVVLQLGGGLRECQDPPDCYSWKSQVSQSSSQ